MYSYASVKNEHVRVLVCTTCLASLDGRCNSPMYAAACLYSDEKQAMARMHEQFQTRQASNGYWLECMFSIRPGKKAMITSVY